MLKSALQDVKETTLAAVNGLLGKLAYLASLRRAHGRYQHWGVEVMYGPESAERAWRAAHAEVVAKVLRTPIATLVEDLDLSSRGSGVGTIKFLEALHQQSEDLLPEGRVGSPGSKHLNSVLRALSSLAQNRARATRSTS